MGALPGSKGGQRIEWDMADPPNSSGVTAAKSMPSVSDDDRRHLLSDLLRSVSRSFYLTLRVLPGGLREPVGLAYLLARAADTIADTKLLPPRERLRTLLAFREQVEGPAEVQALRDIDGTVSEGRAPADERMLLASLPRLFAMLEATVDADGRRIRSVVVTLTRGMESDLTTFPAEDSGRIWALEDPDALDSYTYYVAGCVGEFWTAITMAHTPSLGHWEESHMSQTGVRFGKALQLTNVLRDVPRDLRNGRCYLPRTQLALAGLAPDDLLDPSAGATARPVLLDWIRVDLEHYRAAEEYLLAIPGHCWRLRLAALWPILIGLATIGRLAGNAAWLHPDAPSKVSRGWVYRMVALSQPCAFSDRLARAWIGRLRSQVEAALKAAGGPSGGP